ncbi:hypothetical protein [Deinococcus marmoris]|uniref:Uncharacterized protein n=1 Tax=Deinococcus marmoris TaxID=249408 RepID=A0A1U7P2S7_9DEIO|nr:hypothetical protein [Deinococcus marmoris]OLV19471.1 hypothetical protein BOO71_0002686 [Deinococcus marmoris]
MIGKSGIEPAEAVLDDGQHATVINLLPTLPAPQQDAPTLLN